MQSELLKRNGQARLNQINRKAVIARHEAIPSYYDQLKPIVLSFMKSYQTDFTTHDAKALEGFTGTFIYGLRTTGTDIFCIEPWFRALDEVLNTGKCEASGYFTPNGVNNLIKANFHLKDSFNVMGILHGDRNDRWFIGKNGKIREVSIIDIKATVARYNEQSDHTIELIRQKWQHLKPYPVISNDWTFKAETPQWVWGTTV